MSIAIIADRVLMNEIVQNGIPAYIAHKMKTIVECFASIDKVKIEKHGKIILWQSLQHNACYDELMRLCKEKVIAIDFKIEIRIDQEEIYCTPSEHLTELRRGLLKSAMNI